jgi:transaldolase
MNKMQLTNQSGSDFWNDSCDLAELRDAVSQGAVGATSNPVIVSTVVKKNPATWGVILARLIKDNPTANETDIASKLTEELTVAAAKILMPVFEKTNGCKGRLAVQVDPADFRNSPKMIATARALNLLAPNLTIKLPATAAGVAAMEELTAEGITVTATVCFGVSQAVACAEAVERGLKRGKHDLHPYIAIMVGRLDDHLKRVMEAKGIVTDPGNLEWAGVAAFKKSYAIFRERGYAATLLAAAYRNHMQWSEFLGGKVVLSMPYLWWNRFNASDIEVRSRMDEPVAPHMIQELRNKFTDFSRAYDENGMQPAEFTGFGATVHTLTQFLKARDELTGMIRERMIALS